MNNAKSELLLMQMRKMHFLDSQRFLNFNVHTFKKCKNYGLNEHEVVVLGKKIVYKGILQGTATTYWNGQNIAIKLDDRIEGLPEEFVVYPEFIGTMSPTAGFKVMGKMKRLVAFNVRPGDKLTVEGELILETEGDVEFYRMPASHIYNVSLKIGI